jgi:hypothetical protein
MNRNGQNDIDNDIDYARDPLMAAARQLPRGIAPERDLWPGIAEAIDEQREAPSRGRPGWNRLFAQAAAVLLLVGGSSGVTWLAMKQDAPVVATEPSAEVLNFQPVSGSFGSQYHLGAEFVEARNNLEARLEEELKRLPPETRAEVEANLNTIRAAIVEINMALANEPDNALLQQLLVNAYRDELAVMSRVDGMASSIMRRNDI